MWVPIDFDRVRAMPRQLSFIGLVLCAPLIGGCAATGSSPSDKRTAVQKMRQDVLTELCRTKPAARAQVQQAPGYAVFSNAK